MMSFAKSISFVDPEAVDFPTIKERIDALRMQAYSKASGFTLDLNSLRWRESDQQSYVMIVGDANGLGATMRGEVIADLDLLEKKLECPWDLPFTPEAPVLLLSRAATDATLQGSGLNLLQRYYFIQFAIHHQLSYVMGTFVAGSSRENTLREMGYDFYEHKLGWNQSSYRSERPVHIVALDVNKHGTQALNYCEEHLGNERSTYQFKHQFTALKYVRTL